VDWASNPIVGVKNDNIYTRWSITTSGLGSSGDHPRSRIAGAPPTGTEVPASDTDTLIYP
jgi:hypothetical protein